MSSPPTFDEFVERGKETRVSKWLREHPDVIEVATKLIGEGKSPKTVSRYLHEYYDWPFQSEALVKNLERIRDDS